MSYDDADYRLMRSRWQSGDHVGAAKPVVRAYVRSTRLKRAYRQVQADEVYCSIPGLPKGLGPKDIWKGIWDPKSEWMRLPNILGFKVEQDFEANGVATATIDIDNVAMVETTGVNGIYRRIQRGYYAPFRGHDPQGKRPPVAEKNEWYDMLNDKSTEIMVVGGYGDVVFPLFNGLINDDDLVSHPDRITITARDAGQVLTDQQVFVNAKVRHVKDPITFCDRLQADNTEDVGHAADASDWTPGAHPKWVLDDLNSTRWRSQPRDNDHPGDMPWVQIGLPNGRYESFKIRPTWGGMGCYVAIKARDLNAPGGHGARKHVDGTQYADNEWIDEGNGNIPGTSIPWVKHIDTLRAGENVYMLPDNGYDLGDDSIVRLYFDDLEYSVVKGTKQLAYHAGVDTFQGVRRRLSEAAKREDWILVDDLSDVVRTVLQWAGINEWEVETTGVRLKDKAVFNRGNFLIDIINAAAEQVGYIFYIKPPESFDEDNLDDMSEQESMGIAIFRQNHAMRRQSKTRDPVERIHEDALLQGIQARFTDEPLAYNIRVRGKQKKETKGGRTLGGDDTARWMYVYRPPWSRDATFGPNQNNYRNANIKRYWVSHDNRLRNLDECKVMALLIAFQMALESATAVCEFPAMPTIHLDHQIGVFDTGTGLSTRIWIANKHLEYQGGEQAQFKMSIGGSLIDLPDITRVRKELTRAIEDDINPGLSEWEKTTYGQIYRGQDE